jgi:hypothetical protein
MRPRGIEAAGSGCREHVLGWYTQSARGDLRIAGGPAAAAGSPIGQQALKTVAAKLLLMHSQPQNGVALPNLHT